MSSDLSHQTHRTDESPDGQPLLTPDGDGSLRTPASVLEQTTDDTFCVLYEGGTTILQGVHI